MLACAPTSRPAADGSRPSAAPPPAPKTLTLGLTASIPRLEPALATILGGVTQTLEIHSNSFVATRTDGGLELRLAAQLPSLADGSLAVFPDGTMQTTWRLQPEARWHDGAPVTAEDVVFGAEVYLNPDVGLGARANIPRTDRVEAIDAHTVRIHWKSLFYAPLALGPRELAPLPAHLLKETYAADRERFAALPYWTTEYVHLGPFRLVDFGMGERLVFERFDSYVLGRPRLDRVVLQVIGDPNTLYANLLAGSVDVALGQTLSADQVLQLRREWEQTGGGRIFTRMTTLEFLRFQFDPRKASPPEVARDPWLRRGLLLGLDRTALAEAFYPGFNLVANTFLRPTDQRNASIGMPYAPYRFDREVALRTLAEAGWTRDGAGRLLRQDGEPVELTVRSDAGRAARLAVLADMLRQLGMTVHEEITPRAHVLNVEYRSSFSFVEWSSRGADETLLTIFLARVIPTAQNNWTGNNYGSYQNSRHDLLADRIHSTVDRGEQASLLKQLGEVYTTDWPFLPLQYGVVFTVALNGVQTLGNGAEWEDWNAHLWSRD
jgi:peptide/nickel transport system substrate-binding protein